MQDVFTYENAKTIKGEKLGYLTAIRYLAPADESGRWNLCAAAGACKAVCLYTAGRGVFDSVKDARLRKTEWRMTDRAGHMEAASREIVAASKRADRLGVKLAVRLNGTSDLPGDALDLAVAHPTVQFYDYTKLVGSVSRYIRRQYPSNYHLTLSYDPETVPFETCEPYLMAGVNVAVCFSVKRGAELPWTWNGFEVIDGDEHDLRFLDPKPRSLYPEGFIVGLRAKGFARRANGFAVSV
jgi:Gene product 88